MRSPEQQREPEAGAVSRRDFLRVGGMSVVGLSIAERTALARSMRSADRRSCILILMTGGPSALETFDPKPDAPAEIRGPLKAISTAVPGLFVSESLPLLAQRTGKFTIPRSLYHDAAPIHETGLQLLQTGRLARHGRRSPSFGSVVSRLYGPRGETPPYVVLPRLLGSTGVNAWRGQAAGMLGSDFDPVSPTDGEAAHDEPESVRRQYGETGFGRMLLRARQLVECGVRCVTVNLFDTLAGQVTWDCHGRKPEAPATLYDYRDLLCPQFDRAVAGLLDDLEQRGLLEDTLVVATGEFGRTPYVNEFAGRDHWPGVWSALVAGGGTPAGRMIGASDPHGTAPVDRPIHLGELAATIYQSLGIDPQTHLQGASEPADPPLVEYRPVTELFA